MLGNMLAQGPPPGMPPGMPGGQMPMGPPPQNGGPQICPCCGQPMAAAPGAPPVGGGPPMPGVPPMPIPPEVLAQLLGGQGAPPQQGY